MVLTPSVSRRNFFAYIWHATFFALAYSFMDVDTVMPAMLLKAGGNNFHIGLLTTILMGGSWLGQIFFAPFLYNRPRKKPYLLTGIIIRTITLFAFAYLFLSYQKIDSHWFITIILSLALIFSLSGSFAGISYTDILGKSLLPEKRKKFFSIKQVIFSFGIFISAFAVKKLLRTYEFPENYFLLFLWAAIFLFIATFGFVIIKEVPVEIKRITGIKSYFNAFKNEFRTNPNLLRYLLTINTLGIGISILPFSIAYLKQIHGLSGTGVGNLLIFKTAGLIVAGIFSYLYSQKLRYTQILYIAFSMALIMLVSVLLFSRYEFIFPVIFFTGGIYFSLFSISKSGILLEISDNQNRPLYAGMAGAGSFFISLFPIIGGILIERTGFTTVFGIILIILLSSLLFIRKIRCGG